MKIQKLKGIELKGVRIGEMEEVKRRRQKSVVVIGDEGKWDDWYRGDKNKLLMVYVGGG